MRMKMKMKFSLDKLFQFIKKRILPTNTIEGDFHRMLASKEMCEITENVLKARFVYKNAFSE